MTIIVRAKPAVYPKNALLKYWGSFPLDTSNRRASATKIPEGEMCNRNEKAMIVKQSIIFAHKNASLYQSAPSYVTMSKRAKDFTNIEPSNT